MLQPMRPSTSKERSDSAVTGLPEFAVDMTPASGSAASTVVRPARMECGTLPSAPAALDTGGAWGALASAVGLAGDPGAEIPLVEAVAEVLGLHHDGDIDHDAVAALKSAVSGFLAHPSWQDGTWRRSANPSRRGGRHTGNVDDHPLLSCLVADRRATLERTALNRIRLVIVLFCWRVGWRFR